MTSIAVGEPYPGGPSTGASYPKAIKNFLTRHDYTDDVMAAHINDLQNEVRALEGTLGVNPQLPNASIAERLSALESGLTRPVFSVATNYSGVAPHGPSMNIPLSAPPAGWDPFHWYNGNGFTIGRTGWYSLQAQIGWDASPQVGTRRFVITINGGWVVVDDKEGYIDVNTRYTNLSHIGLFGAGTKIGLLVHHDLASGQRVRAPRLSGVFLRAV